MRVDDIWDGLKIPKGLVLKITIPNTDDAFKM